DRLRQLVDGAAGLVDHTGARVHPLGALLGGQHGRVGGALDVGEDRAHLGGGALGLLGQGADLVGDDGEAFALLAGPAGLDGGVERQQVGLVGQVVDRGDDLADLLALLGEGQDVVGDGLDALADGRHALGGLFDRGHAVGGDAVGVP